MKNHYYLLMICFFLACSDDSEVSSHDPPVQADIDIYTLPIVVHIIHNGEEVGEGTNLSIERIMKQVEILNEDFRKKKDTRGYNNHPDGDDAKIQFVLAKQDPDGNPTNGIVRKQISTVPDHVPNSEYHSFAYLSYWDSDHYINIWTAPYPESMVEILLGKSTGPETDLPGIYILPEPDNIEGIIINWAVFGESDFDTIHNLGRTLTHEMGHYLGLMHTWGSGDCELNDYCEDTPAVDHVVWAASPYLGCQDEEVQVANYMNYSPDDVMNMFTKDQIGRMRYVLENSPRRNSLLTSKGLDNPK
ncbi:M43 family zinc metalloprotease [Muricauda amoyensis]|uniref:M43 family zinc metalloprotease n=1 Tax=Flagellimonas amoyensis TaxID=2169401 RepID=UPI000D354798|nr:M43 family zinc metalloprotease [Allomuricauda amoyensis]